MPMMKKVFCPLIALACLQLVSVLAPAQRRQTPRPKPQVESNMDSWKTYTSVEGRYSVLMPGVPQKSGQTIKTAVGWLPNLIVSLKTDMAEYRVSYSDFPEVLEDPNLVKAAYDGGRDQLLSSYAATLVGERDINVGGYAGRHFTAIVKGKLLSDRIVAAKKRFYQVVVVTEDYRKNSPTSVRLHESTINKFLDSFTLRDGDKDETVDNAPREVTSIDLGSLDGSVYVNPYFKFRIKLPEGWNIAERESNNAALQVGRDLVKGSDTRTNEAVDRSVAKTVLLFTTSKFPPQTPNVRQAMIQCGAERINNTVTSATYLQSSKDLLLKSSLKYSVVRDVHTETIAGLSFSVMELQQSAYGFTVKQRYYATIRKGFALFFVTSYLDDADGTEMEQVLKGSKFE